MEEEAKPIRQPQRRLNPHLQEVVLAEVLKLLQAGIIYPIFDNPWVSLTQVVPKKSGITVVQNEKGEEIATRLTSGWRVFIDYRKLNAVTRKDHFPLSFIDQVLERVSGHPFYCFLYGYSRYFQIEIDVEDQENTTFTCPFGTYAYRRMPFGLCNAPATFQRCMISIFSDMVERIVEVFMDDISIYGRIVLRHIISEKGIEVDKAKVELIVKLPSPTTVKGVRQFLGHVGFYRRFIKDFSKLSKPLCELLAKDAKFIWDERCQKSFDQLKQFLTTTLIVRASNWQLPFKVMCDARDFALGAVLGQREDGKPYVIYYASKTLNEAQKTKMKLNLVVDKNSQKVLYAEAGKNFIDFLFNLLTLLVWTIIMQLTEKGMIGKLDTKKAEEGYVKEVVTYMVTDALVMKPLSTMSIVDLLNKPNINEVGGELEETLVDFTMLEGLKLLIGIYAD
ncbi:Retrovirus-related Pol polyprotein from transposon 17.6 [Vitis vinifera]|uniref:Retrovirus-related Pol polyprotein from transposon 17.6 n=1 Tax=Vitis vinifera TaxID=29760 RepID=A0A438GYW7_VITVI|nr:Retrovirus-related Pol polyprotein from transposon 17.6 [Vitis vinifera]